MTEIVREGRRVYFKGSPFAAKDVLKEAGAKWDPDERAWWVSTAREGEAQLLLAKIEAAATAAVPAALPPASGPMVDVPGKTYPVKDQLKAMGGAYDAASKTWRVPQSRLPAATALVLMGPPVGSKPAAFVHSKCKNCGARPNERGWPRIYKNGVCSDCYSDMND